MIHNNFSNRIALLPAKVQSILSIFDGSIVPAVVLTGNGQLRFDSEPGRLSNSETLR